MNLRIYFINFGYYSSQEFTNREAALAFGKSRGFQFSIWDGPSLVGSWCPIGGTRLIDYDPDVQCD